MISVIIPIYNVEDYLVDCLNSVINQTYRDLEIILVDDGSVDACSEICDKYSLTDKRIKVIHKKNGGLSDARNAGIDIATGEYITFVDSDDMLDLNMISYLYELIEADKSDISSCRRLRINENGTLISNNLLDEGHYCVKGADNCMHEYLSKNNFDTVAWAKLYRMSLFKDIRYPVGRYNEDVFTTYKVVAMSKSISIGLAQLYLYRERSNSIMTSSFSVKHLDSIYGKLEMQEYVSQMFPKELKYAKAQVVYACNQCVMKIAKSNYRDKETIKMIQGLYRKNIMSFLTSGSSVVSKCFAMFNFLSTIGVIRLMSRI